MSKTTNSIIPLAVPSDLHKEIQEAARRTKLSQAAVMRSGLRIGVPEFVNRVCPAITKPPGK